MTLFFRIILACLFLVEAGLSSALAQVDLGTLKKGVVKITTEFSNTRKTGTGFISAKSKKYLFIVTASHVVEGEAEAPHSIQLTFYTHQEEAFEAKIQVKEKKGRIEAKLQWRWSTLADYAHQEREQYNTWLSTMKSVKKRMGSSFKELTREIEAGNYPGKQSVDDFVATCRVFAEAADPDWKEAMDEFMDHLENFIRAVEKQEFEVMHHEMRDLGYRMKACHKEFK